MIQREILMQYVREVDDIVLYPELRGEVLAAVGELLLDTRHGFVWFLIVAVRFCWRFDILTVRV